MEKSSIKYSIVLVPFPFDDFSQTKLRPAICLSDEIGDFKHIILGFITSNVSLDDIETDVFLDIKLNKETGLQKDSIIRLHKLMSIPKNIIKRKLGSLPKELKNELDYKISILFKLKK